MIKQQTMLAVGMGFILIVSGCKPTDAPYGTSTTPPQLNTAISTSSIQQNLGWLGAQASPVAKPISFPAPDDATKTLSPGTIVLQSMETESPLRDAEMQTGDIIVRAGETWLPVKDDPTLDLIRIIEDTIDAGRDSIELGYLRNGKFLTASIMHQLVSLDQGLPGQSTRFENSLDQAVIRLKRDMNQDGSFGTADNDTLRLRATAVAGLALIASSPSENRPEIERAYQFISAELDERQGATASSISLNQNNESEQEPSKPGTSTEPEVKKISIASSQLDALTASYLIQFLAQSDRKEQDANYNQKVSGLLSALVRNQHPNGAWSIDQAQPDTTDSVDLKSTYVTNQALLALGTLERQGIRAAGRPVELGCQYLVRQWELRAEQDCDSRTSSALSAGTAAALISLNCHPTDETLITLVDDAISKTDQLLNAPSFALAGLLSTAIVAQATNDENWFSFHSKIKYQLVASQRLDGSFPTSDQPTADNSIVIENDATITQAHWVKILAMRKQNLPLLTGKTKPALAQSRTSLGKPFEKIAMDSEKFPAILKKNIKFSLKGLDSSDPDFEKKIKEKLKKEFGIDNPNITIQRRTTFSSGASKGVGNQEK